LFLLATRSHFPPSPSSPGHAQPFLNVTFSELSKGTFGTLNPAKIVVRGWSGGAQLVSWLYQLQATNTLPGRDVTIAGGVMLSGGSYTCYNDPNDPTLPVQPVTTCQGCTSGGPSHCLATTDPHCDR